MLLLSWTKERGTKKSQAVVLSFAKEQDAQENGLSELSLRTGCYMDSYEIYKKYGFKEARADQRFMYMNISSKKQ